MKKFEIDNKVTVAECYLNDEVTENYNTSPTATVFTEPSDSEELVGIIYEGGDWDFVPQDILEVTSRYVFPTIK
jgi:hypothetical protein